MICDYGGSAGSPRTAQSRCTTAGLTLELGNKAVAADPPKGNRVYQPELPDAVQDIHSEEHLVLVTADAEKYQPGDTLVAIPVHICPTSALYDRVGLSITDE